MIQDTHDIEEADDQVQGRTPGQAVDLVQVHMKEIDRPVTLTIVDRDLIQQAGQEVGRIEDVNDHIQEVGQGRIVQVHIQADQEVELGHTEKEEKRVEERRW